MLASGSGRAPPPHRGRRRRAAADSGPLHGLFVPRCRRCSPRCDARVLSRMDLIPKPDQVVSAASNVAHKVLYGGLADLRPMPRTLIDEGTLREVYHYRPAAKVREQGDPVLLVTPLAAPALCFDLRRGCSLVEHFVTAGRPTYLVEYGEVSFKDRNLGMEHWIDEVVPDAIREVSAHAGGRPVHVIGWSLGGIFALLTAADQPDLPIASLTVVGVADRREAGAAGGADAAAAQPHRRPGRDHPRLPAMGGAPKPLVTLGVPAVVVPEAGHQAAGDRDPPRRRRLPRPARGGRPLHRQHDRLPRPHVRAALPPVRARATRSCPAQHRLRRPDHRAGRHHRAGAGLRRRHRRHRAGRRGEGRRRRCSPARPRCASRSCPAGTSGCSPAARARGTTWRVLDEWIDQWSSAAEPTPAEADRAAKKARPQTEEDCEEVGAQDAQAERIGSRPAGSPVAWLPLTSRPLAFAHARRHPAPQRHPAAQRPDRLRLGIGGDRRVRHRARADAAAVPHRQPRHRRGLGRA